MEASYWVTVVLVGIGIGLGIYGWWIDHSGSSKEGSDFDTAVKGLGFALVGLGWGGLTWLMLWIVERL